MENKIILVLLIFLTPFAIFAQAPLELQALEIPAQEVRIKGIKMVECLSGHYQDEEIGDNFDIERVYFGANGELARMEEHHFSEGQLSDGMERDLRYLYKGDSITEIELVEYEFVPGYTKSYSYEEGRLKETKEEGLMMKNKYIEYSYDSAGRVLQVAYSTRYTSVEKYFYEGNHLVKTAYFRLERDSIPRTETFYQYWENGKMREKLEVNTADKDTLLLLKYDEKEQLSFLLKQMESGVNGYSEEGYFDYEAFYTSDSEGNISQIKYTAPQFFAEDKPRDSLLWAYAHYQFSEGLMMSFDSAGIHFEITYDEEENIIGLLGLEVPKRDTVFVETREYNAQNQLLEVMHWDYGQGQSFKWVYAYEGGDRTRESYLRYLKQRECVIKRDYDPSLRRLQSKEYCRINGRRLPADIPTEIISQYFDANGNLTYHNRQYGDHDGSIQQSGIDSLVYQNGQLHQVFNITSGSYGITLVNTHNYGAEGLLDRILTTTESADTIYDRTFIYQDGKLHQQGYKVFDRHREKTYVRIQQTLDYNAAEQLVSRETKKVTKSSFGESDNTENLTKVNFEYNEQGLLQKQSELTSDWRGPTEFRKTYRYFYD